MRSALLVIDVQRALVAELAEERRREFLGTLGRVIDGARTGGVPVVYVRHADEELVVGTDGWEIVDAIGPRGGEPIVEKRFRDSFRETDLDAVLAHLDVEHLVVCGMQTEFCVDATVREAERRGFRVTLVGDAHATYPVDGMSAEQIVAHVNRVARGIADVVDSARVWALEGSGERG
jgi:nicotinamidase-related amidase